MGREQEARGRGPPKNGGPRANVAPQAIGLFEILEPRVPHRSPPNILGGLKAPDEKKILARARYAKLAPNEILFRQGDVHDGIFLIESGLIRTFYTAPSGREITLAYWEAGNFAGGPDVFEGSTHYWSGMAVRDTEVLQLRSADLREFVKTIPDFAIGLVEALEFKGRCFSALVQMLGTRSVGERLARLLRALIEHFGEACDEGILVDAHLSHEDIAHLVGASRQWVTTTLDQLQGQDILRIRRRQLVVLHPERLGALDPR